jgi:hypothetical protein
MEYRRTRPNAVPMGHASRMTDLHTKSQLTTIEVRNAADGSIVGSVPNDQFGDKPRGGRK